MSDDRNTVQANAARIAELERRIECLEQFIADVAAAAFDAAAA